MAGNKIVKASALKRPRIIECPSGSCYRIRPLPPSELYEVMQGFADVTAIPTTQAEADAAVERVKRTTDPAQILAMFERAVAKALIEPVIGEGEDQIQIGDIPMPDFVHLGGSILSISGLNKEAAERVGPLSETAAF